MPLYEYQCDACGRRFEKIQKFSDAPIEVCPTCGGHVQKLVSSPAFQFKGTGWYVTDYSRKDKGGSSDGDKGGDKGSDKGGEKGGSASAGGEKGSGAATESSGSSSGTDAKSAPAPAKDTPPASTTKS